MIGAVKPLHRLASHRWHYWLCFQRCTPRALLVGGTLPHHRKLATAVAIPVAKNLKQSANNTETSTALPIRPLPPLVHQQAAHWERGDALAVLQQVAHEGTLGGRLFSQLYGDRSDPTADSSTEEEDVEVCGVTEFTLAAELCNSLRIRDFVLLAALAQRLVVELPRSSTDLLIRIGTAYASLGVIHDPLFHKIATGLLFAWRASESKGEGTPEEIPPLVQVVQVARAFSAQRMRHGELFDRIVQILRVQSQDEITPADALSLLHSLTFLGLSAELGDLRWTLEQCATVPGFAALSPAALAELCYVLFLSRRSGERLRDVSEMLAAVAPPVLRLSQEFWLSREGLTLHHRLLLLRSAMRYLHKDAYNALPVEVSRAFRLVHRMDVPRRSPRPTVNFIRKLSAVLTKLKIGHMSNAERGPLTLDIVERDRKVVYECNHFDRFYSGTIEKIASMRLQERIVKAMGYRVVQVPHWQWNKIKHRRQRTEYVRMSRYYAIKDRREFAPRDEVPEDLASNEFDHLGEYFFRKDRPAAPWSWFQPRYDASERLPRVPPASSGNPP